MTQAIRNPSRTGAKSVQRRALHCNRALQVTSGVTNA